MTSPHDTIIPAMSDTGERSSTGSVRLPSAAAAVVTARHSSAIRGEGGRREVTHGAGAHTCQEHGLHAYVVEAEARATIG